VGKREPGQFDSYLKGAPATKRGNELGGFQPKQKTTKGGGHRARSVRYRTFERGRTWVPFQAADPFRVARSPLRRGNIL